MLDLVASRLAEQPHANVGIFPTPLQLMRRMSDLYERPIYIKRDDLAGLALGGNKIRMLRFTAGDALARGANVFVAGGFTQTNHPAQVAAVGSALGIATEVVLDTSKGRALVGNLLLHNLMNVKVHYVEGGRIASIIAACRQLIRLLTKSGHRPHLLTFTREVRALCALAYVEGFIELKRQLDSGGVTGGDIFVGSGGPTYAGLLCGSRAGGGNLRVHGVPAPGLRRKAVQLVMDIVKDIAKTLRLGTTIEEKHITLIGEGKAIYDRLYRDAAHALRAVAQLEGIILDPFYSANAMAEMMRWLDQNPGTSPVIFLHTGGVAALFAHQSAVAATRHSRENPKLLISRVIQRE